MSGDANDQMNFFRKYISSSTTTATAVAAATATTARTTLATATTLREGEINFTFSRSPFLSTFSRSTGQIFGPS